MVLEKARIYGVDGVGQSSPSLTRTDAAEGMTFTKGARNLYRRYKRSGYFL